MDPPPLVMKILVFVGFRLCAAHVLTTLHHPVAQKSNFSPSLDFYRKTVISTGRSCSTTRGLQKATGILQNLQEERETAT